MDLPLTDYKRERLHRSLTLQTSYGTVEWAKKVGQILGLPSTLKEWGRPKKHYENQPVPFARTMSGTTFGTLKTNELGRQVLEDA
jgi:P2-related tail formation protein